VLINGALKRFGLFLCYAGLQFTGAGTPQFCAALTASRLTYLLLSDVNLFHDYTNGCEVLAAVRGHPCLTELNISGNFLEHVRDGQALVGEVLASLLIAPSALVTLNVSNCNFRNACGKPFFTALAGNTTLRELNCSKNKFSEKFCKNHVIPAVAANRSLRHLRAYEPIFEDGRKPSMEEAQDLVYMRGRDDAST
jgi:hypothetical protein